MTGRKAARGIRRGRQSHGLVARPERNGQISIHQTFSTSNSSHTFSLQVTTRDVSLLFPLFPHTCSPLVPPPPLSPFFPPLSLLLMLLPVLFRAPTLPLQLPSSPPPSFASHLLPAPSCLVPLPHIMLPSPPPGGTRFSPFSLSLLLPSHHSFSPYFSPLPPSPTRDPVRFSSSWAFTVFLCVCSSSPFLAP